MTMLACGTWETGTPGNRKFNIDFCWDFHQNQKMVCEWQRCTCPSPAAIPSGICNPPRTCLPWIPLCPVCQAIYTPLLNCHRGNVGWLGHWQTILLCPFSPAPVHQLLGHDLCCSPNLQCHNSQDLLLIHHHPSFLRSSVWLSVSLPSPRKLCCCASLQYATLSLYCAGRQFFSGVCFCSMSLSTNPLLFVILHPGFHVRFLHFCIFLMRTCCLQLVWFLSGTSGRILGEWSFHSCNMLSPWIYCNMLSSWISCNMSPHFNWPICCWLNHGKEGGTEL